MRKFTLIAVSVLAMIAALQILFFGVVGSTTGVSVMRFYELERLMFIYPALISEFFIAMLKQDHDKNKKS